MPGDTKLIINEQDAFVRTCKKVEYAPSKLDEKKEELEEAIKETIPKYLEIIFGSDTPTCMACLDQKIYDQKLMEDTVRKLAWEGLQKNTVMDGDTMIDKRTGDVLEVDSAYWNDKF